MQPTKKFGTGLLAFVISCLSSQPAMAQAPTYHVFGEKDGQYFPKCQISYASAISSVRSNLRYNAQPIGTEIDHNISVYININALDVEIGGQFKGCAISYRISFYSYGYDTLSMLPDKKRRFVRYLHCDNAGLVLHGPLGAQSVLNEALKDDSNRCLDRILNPESDS